MRVQGSQEENRIRLTILGGYLGSGKSTWLRHQLFQKTFGHVHVLVNEAAETGIDDTLLQAQADAMTLLAGGCACCTGRTELIQTLWELCDQRSRTASTDQRLERIVLETSGLADPGIIAQAIRSDPVLVHHVLLEDIIVMADAVNVIAQLSSEHLGRAQIEAADRIILSKVDLQTPKAFSAVRSTLARLNPGAEITISIKGELSEIEFDLFAPAYDLPALDTNTSSEPITPARLDIDPSIDWAAFSVWLSALLHAHGEHIVRVKGVFSTPAGPLLLQGVRNSVQSPEVLPSITASPRNEIVFIGRGFQVEELEKSLKYLARE